MQTSKYEIGANLQGLEFRRQANEILAALASSNAGNLEPASAQAGTVWLDTSNDKKHLLKIHNKANSAWGILCSIDAQSGVVDKIDAYTKVESDSKFARIDQVIGVNQTTKVATAQKTFNAFYENTTDKPIMLYIDVWNNGVIMQLTLNVTVGSATLTSSNTAITTAATHTNITALIPPKTRYIVTSNGVLYSWVELS